MKVEDAASEYADICHRVRRFISSQDGEMIMAYLMREYRIMDYGAPDDAKLRGAQNVIMHMLHMGGMSHEWHREVVKAYAEAGKGISPQSLIKIIGGN